jgi:hypothetical protein
MPVGGTNVPGRCICQLKMSSSKGTSETPIRKSSPVVLAGWLEDGGRQDRGAFIRENRSTGSVELWKENVDGVV